MFKPGLPEVQENKHLHLVLRCVQCLLGLLVGFKMFLDMQKVLASTGLDFVTKISKNRQDVEL